MKKAILIFVALMILALPISAKKSSFMDDGYYHYYQIVGLRLDTTGKQGVEEARVLLKLLVLNTGLSDISRWRLITGQDAKIWPEILLFGSSIEVISSKKDATGLIVGLKPDLEVKSPLKINSGKIQIVLEEKTEGGWREVKKINLIIKEVIEKSPRFL